jgi:hypothetical protein
MYRIKGSRKAWSHGNYIRPTYVDIWREASAQAEEVGVSLSEFISHALYVFMTGRAPKNGKLRGKNVVQIERVNE